MEAIVIVFERRIGALECLLLAPNGRRTRFVRAGGIRYNLVRARRARDAAVGGVKRLAAHFESTPEALPSSICLGYPALSAYVLVAHSLCEATTAQLGMINCG